MFVHWILYNIPVHHVPTGETTITVIIPEGLPRGPYAKGYGIQGVNSFGWIGYGGPCPPRGDKPHHYIVRVYALDTTLDLPPGAGYDALMRAIKGHVLGVGELVGLYRR
jgi:Raf kinase inhibitor-like YbhB/YbcL family protein